MIDDRIMILENYDPRVNYINSWFGWRRKIN
jgi:hypothetical protein